MPDHTQLVIHSCPKLIALNRMKFLRICLHTSGWVMRLYFDLTKNDPILSKLCDLACSDNNLDLCNASRLPGSFLQKNLFKLKNGTQKSTKANHYILLTTVSIKRCIIPSSNHVLLGGRVPGCGSVGRAVDSDTRGPRFESSHRQKLY